MGNEQLWVELTPQWDGATHHDGRPGRWLIVGSAHTHRGHFAVTRIGAPGYASVNLGDVVAASPEARWWVQGFLAAEEPSLYEFLGQDDELYDAADDRDRERWAEWSAGFRTAGSAPPLQEMPPRDLDLTAWAQPRPWVYVGGQFRVWRDGGWTVADPQPVTGGEIAWPGTSCAGPGSHSMVVVDPVLVCELCHWVS